MLIDIIYYYFYHLYEWRYHARIPVAIIRMNFFQFNAVFFAWFGSLKYDFESFKLKDE
jgi:hypothetical protein